MLVAALAFGACSATGLPDVADTNVPMDATSDVDPVDIVVADVPVDRGPPVRPPMIQRTMPDTALETRRRACEFGRGAWAAETLGMDVPVGNDIPIDHVLVLMLENRSFDHYFSNLREAGQMDAEVPARDWANAHSDGRSVARFHTTEMCVRDPAHGWNPVHTQYNSGAMDGFVTTNEPLGERAMGYVDATDIPFYYALATTFAIGDHYFCSILGPTVPNRLYLLSGTSFGLGANTLVASDTRDTPAPTVMTLMDAAQIEWRDYSPGLRMIQYYPYYGNLRRETRPHLRNIDQLIADLAAGSLPPLSIVEPAYTGEAGVRTDEHPPGTPQAGEANAERIVRALFASPVWRRTALFILYDEHGGFADHVAPPEACPPDGSPPVDAAGRPLSGGRFDRLGIRVPFMVISPYARSHFVGHRNYDHSSVLRFIEARFGLPAMTHRDANATPPYEMFDFANPPFMTPPAGLPSSRPDPAVQTRCTALFPGSGGL